MAIPTVYRSTDPGAPVVDYNTPGSYLNMLRKCLVDGYGSKAGAGWTEEFTGTNVAVFRNSVAAGGTGCYVRFDDTNTAQSSRPVVINAYSAMSDINTGTDGTTDRWGYRAASSFTSLPRGVNSWVVVADAVSAWVCVTQDGDGRQTVIPIVGIGDIDSYVMSDAWRYFVAAGVTLNSTNQNGWLGSANVTGTVPLTGASAGVVLPKDHTGLTGPWAAGLGVALNANTAVAGSNYPAYPSVTDASAAVIPFYLAGNSVLRGRLRGAYVMLHNNMTGFSLGDELNDVVAPGSKLVFFPGGGGTSGGGGIWIETALDWG